jgi:hypothetical protein
MLVARLGGVAFDLRRAGNDGLDRAFRIALRRAPPHTIARLWQSCHEPSALKAFAGSNTGARKVVASHCTFDFVNAGLQKPAHAHARIGGARR